MPFVHLANGDVKHHTQEELDDRYGDETPKVYRDGGVESAVIGIYPDDVEFEDEASDDDETADNEREDETE
jgi:hypothetical protein